MTSEDGANLEEIGGHGDPWRFLARQHMANVGGKSPLDSDFQAQDTWDAVDLSSYPDLDVLIELHGHVRQVKSRVRRATGLGRQEFRELISDEYTSHLVLLGGVDWDAVTAELLRSLSVGGNVHQHRGRVAVDELYRRRPCTLLPRHGSRRGPEVHPAQGDEPTNDASTSTTSERVRDFGNGQKYVLLALEEFVWGEVTPYRGSQDIISSEGTHPLDFEPLLGRSVRLTPSAAIRPRTVRLWEMARDYVQAFVLRLIALRRRVEPARFARMLEFQLRTGRLWAAFRPARPPGQLMMASGQVTRGPDGARMTQALVIRGELLALM